jgi:hypothetical protein
MTAWGAGRSGGGLRRAGGGCTTKEGPASGGGAPTLAAVREEGSTPRGEGSATAAKGRW